VRIEKEKRRVKVLGLWEMVIKGEGKGEDEGGEGEC